jgi:hypothetical protein
MIPGWTKATAVESDQLEANVMTDATDHMNRPGAGPLSSMISVGGIPTNHYINHNPETGMVEIAKSMPRGVQDELIKEFPDESSARSWALVEFHAGRLG